VRGAMRQYSHSLFLLLQLIIAPAFADSGKAIDAGLLDEMALAAHRLDYSGVFVYQSGGSVEMSRITHVADKSGEHERLEEVGGRRRELIRDNDQVWLFVDGHKVHIEKRQINRAFPALLPEQISELKENYSVREVETDDVAGYHTRGVVFLPKDNLRYARKMWAHSDSGLLLKAVVLDDRGGIIEQYAFMQLDIGGNIDRKWILPEGSSSSSIAEAQRFSGLPKAEQLEKPCGWQVDALPSGFRKIVELRRPFRGGAEPVTQIVFSDGLAGISVFIEKIKDATHIHSGLSGRGVANVYKRIVGENLVTVVGEVPPRAVMQVGDSVRYAGQ
jgi:sigma-E factor negative regulatory protein RseB